MNYFQRALIDADDQYTIFRFRLSPAFLELSHARAYEGFFKIGCRLVRCDPCHGFVI